MIPANQQNLCRVSASHRVALHLTTRRSCKSSCGSTCCTQTFDAEHSQCQPRHSTRRRRERRRPRSSRLEQVDRVAAHCLSDGSGVKVSCGWSSARLQGCRSMRPWHMMAACVPSLIVCWQSCSHMGDIDRLRHGVGNTKELQARRMINVIQQNVFGASG